MDEEKNEFTRKKGVEDPITEVEEINQFTQDQQLINCQFCKKRILTETDQESTWIGIAISIILLLIFKLYSLILISMLIPLTKRTNHRCPSCLNIVGVHSFYDIISLKDKVISYQIGNFALIINRKQLLGIFTFIFFCLCFFFIFNGISLSRGDYLLKHTWSDFQSDCNKNIISSNHEQNLACNSRYKYQNINWKGWAIRIDYEDRIFTRYRVTVMVKMDANEKEDIDLVLKLDDEYYHDFKSVILNITRGDYIEFNATLLHTGGIGNPVIADCFGIEQKTGHISIHPHINHDGRYYSDEEKHLQKDQKVFGDLPNLILDNETDIVNESIENK